MGRVLSFVLAIALCGTPFFASPAAAATYSPSLYSGMQWRLLGPFRGGRALAVTGVPGNPERFYFGSVGGGVWETNNAGQTWTPIFDKEPIASIGSIAVAPSDPNVIYVGSGESDMRSDVQWGDGMYKSTDAGKTWTHIGLDDTRQIGRIVIDPKDPQTVYVAALGHQYGPNAMRGIFKTTDGGATWHKILYKNDNVGAIDIAMDPSDSNTLFAALWQTRRPPWNVYPPSNGPGGGLYKTTDGGATWTQIAGHGFPAHVGRVGVAYSPADSSRVYATVDTNDRKTGGVYRSDDGGATWRYMDGERRIWQRGWYFGEIRPDPKDKDEVYVMNTSTYRSTDGGKSFVAIKGAPGGDDYHSMWIDPDNSDRIILGSDQGVVISVDGAKTWSSWYNQPTGQFYHVALDNRFPFWVYGAQQDSGAAMVVNRSRRAGIGPLDWRPIDVGGESGYLAPDPLHPGVVYGGTITVENVDTGWEQNIDPALNFPGTIWRSDWTQPVVFSPADPHALYLAHQSLFRTTDGGRTWQLISPNLTRKTNTVPGNLDPTTAKDSTGLAHRGVIYTIAPSPLRAQEIWAGTDDGLVWITRNGGKTWQNVTPPQLTPWSKVGIIDASHFDPGTAYAAVDRHRLDDNRPYIYRTADYGQHWTLAVEGIKSDDFVNVVREDPKRRGLLYAGTEHGVDVSFDDGTHWQSLQRNLPVASVRDIAFRNGTMVIATHGRAFWALDDLSPLRQIDGTVADAPNAYLFKPQAAYRVRPGNDEGTPFPPEVPKAKNPPDGAILDYYVRDVRTPVVLEILDANGRLVRRWSSAQKPRAVNPRSLDIPAFWVVPPKPPSAARGEHRFVWDFHYKDENGPLAPPGTYRVRMTVNGKSYAQSFALLRDPRIRATNADLRAQFALAERIEDALAQVKEAQGRIAALRKTTKNATLRARLDALTGPQPAGSPDNSVPVPSNDFTSFGYLHDSLEYLESMVESADVRPTPDNYSAFAKLQAQLRRNLAALHAIAGGAR